MSDIDKYNQIRTLVQSAGGRFISAEFVKKDGTIRRMQIQPAALKNHLAENPSPSAQQATETRAANNPNLLNVWDVKKQAPRSVNMDTLRALTVDKRQYTF